MKKNVKKSKELVIYMCPICGRLYKTEGKQFKKHIALAFGKTNACSV
jgi:uncharacterized C2H2 Zn-finger protein